MSKVCAVLVMSTAKGWTERCHLLDKDTGTLYVLYALPSSGRGKTKIPRLFLNFCPFCGGPQVAEGDLAGRGMQCVNKLPVNFGDEQFTAQGFDDAILPV